MTETDPVNSQEDNILAQLLQRTDIQDLIAKGNAQGQIAYPEFLSALPEDEFDEKEVDALYRHLIESGFKIVNEEEPETEPEDIELASIEIEAEEDADLDAATDPPAGALTGDPVRMYLRQIGRVPLLDPVEEMWLAMRVSAADYVIKTLKDLQRGNRTPPQRKTLRQWQTVLEHYKLEPFSIPAEIEPPQELTSGEVVGTLLQELGTDWPLLESVCPRKSF
jgi:hypothetical protein